MILPGIIILILFETILNFLSKKYNLSDFYKSLRVGVAVLVLFATYLIASNSIIDFKTFLIFLSLLFLIFIKKEIHPLIIVFLGGIGVMFIKML